jgi:hypothetical protein
MSRSEIFYGAFARVKPPVAPLFELTRRVSTKAKSRRRMTTGIVETLLAISAEARGRALAGGQIGEDMHADGEAGVFGHWFT